MSCGYARCHILNVSIPHAPSQRPSALCRTIKLSKQCQKQKVKPYRKTAKINIKNFQTADARDRDQKSQTRHFNLLQKNIISVLFLECRQDIHMCACLKKRIQCHLVEPLMGFSHGHLELVFRANFRQSRKQAKHFNTRIGI